MWVATNTPSCRSPADPHVAESNSPDGVFRVYAEVFSLFHFRRFLTGIHASSQANNPNLFALGQPKPAGTLFSTMQPGGSGSGAAGAGAASTQPFGGFSQQSAQLAQPAPPFGFNTAQHAPK